jgi:hypothetical protein
MGVRRRAAGPVVLAVLAGLLLVLGPVAPARAEPYRSPASCGKSAVYHATVRFRISGGHYLDVSERACHNGTFLKWASQPRLSFPSVKLSPLAPFESFKVTQKPFIYSSKTCLGGPCRITWRFVVQTRTLKDTVEVRTDAFYFRAYPAYVQVCRGSATSGSSCASKTWTRG